MKTYEELEKTLGALRVEIKGPEGEKAAAASKAVREVLDSSPVAASCYFVRQPSPLEAPRRFDCDRCRKKPLFIPADMKKAAEDSARCAGIIGKSGIPVEADLSAFCPECNPGGFSGTIKLTVTRPDGSRKDFDIGFSDLRLLCAFVSGEKIVAEDYACRAENEIKSKILNILKIIYSAG